MGEAAGNKRGHLTLLFRDMIVRSFYGRSARGILACQRLDLGTFEAIP
ncbi:MAG: hypothetical protein ACLPPF_09030 [Rhodomicrobium sp.]